MRLPNGYGTVYKLSGKRRKPYIARRTIGWGENGKQLLETVGYYPTKALALQALSEYNDSPYDLTLAKMTFAEVYKRWYKENFDEDSNKNTTRNYSVAYSSCVPLYDMAIGDIRGVHMQKILDNSPKGYQSVKRIRILFNQLFKYCMEKELVKRNYAEYLKVKSDTTLTEKQAFSSEDIAVLWKNLNNNEYVKIVLVLVYCGVRISELLDLKKDDVNLEEQYFIVRESKTDAGRNRVVPIADKTLPFWKEFMANSQCDYAFTTVECNKLSYDNFKKRYWFPLMNELKMSHTPHETRHAFISQLVMRNQNQTIIKKIVGHKSIMNLTERVYTHVEIQELLNAVNSI